MITPQIRVEQPVSHGDAMQANQSDVMQASRLTTLPPAPELDGEEEIEPPLLWVALDKERGLLICCGLKLEVTAFVGTIFQSRVVRVMADRDGQVLCASSNRKAADVGRPGRECGQCEDRSAVCFPHWWISWREQKSGRVFAHTLGRTGSLHFTRYAARLRRMGLTPSQVTTRLFVQEARTRQHGPVHRSLQFTRVEDKNDPFLD